MKALKWSPAVTPSWASLCNNVSTIQGPEIQSNGSNENSQYAWLQLSPMTPFRSLLNMSVLSPVFLIYKECPLQHMKEKSLYIGEDGGRNNGISFLFSHHNHITMGYSWDQAIGVKKSWMRNTAAEVWRYHFLGLKTEMAKVSFLGTIISFGSQLRLIN